jgi:hypothetical protein
MCPEPVLAHLMPDVMGGAKIRAKSPMTTPPPDSFLVTFDFNTESVFGFDKPHFMNYALFHCLEPPTGKNH